MKEKKYTAVKSMTVAARRAKVVAWLPSSTCPHWARKKTRMAAEARVPPPSAVAMAVTQASRLQATSLRHSPFWQLHHSQPTSILGAGFAPLHSNLCSSAQVATVTHRAVAESSWSTRNFGGCQESPSFSLTSTPFPPLLGTTRPTTALTSGQVKGELPLLRKVVLHALLHVNQ